MSARNALSHLCCVVRMLCCAEANPRSSRSPSRVECTYRRFRCRCNLAIVTFFSWTPRPCYCLFVRLEFDKEYASTPVLCNPIRKRGQPLKPGRRPSTLLAFTDTLHSQEGFTPCPMLHFGLLRLTMGPQPRSLFQMFNVGERLEDL